METIEGKLYGKYINNKKLLKNVTWELRRAEKHKLLSMILNVILGIVIAIQAIKIYIN
tara:strand:- start:1497 stop:1670 length:174 start_codon:yes stop_codon:yes gene_type:complete